MTGIIEQIKKIAIEIDKAIKTKDTGKVESCNTSGDVQAKLDVISDEIVEKHLSTVPSVAEIISEEKEDAVKLNSDGEWTGVPEILKLTMTAFYKIMESHSNTIKEMENALIMKSNKVDVHNLMSSKVNLKDFRQTVSDISQDIEARVSLDQVKQILESRLDSSGGARGKNCIVIDI